MGEILNLVKNLHKVQYLRPPIVHKLTIVIDVAKIKDNLCYDPFGREALALAW